MRCLILRDFTYSFDGYTALPAVKGFIVDLPDHLAPGLIEGGYASREAVHPDQLQLRVQKDAGASPENKALSRAPENKRGRR
jgi:hypothetical protein